MWNKVLYFIASSDLLGFYRVWNYQFSYETETFLLKISIFSN